MMSKVALAILMPFIGAIIGYGTNYLAVKMLFHPKKKILGMQGVVPKRKNEIAKRIAEASPIILPESLGKVWKLPFIGKKITNWLKDDVERKINKLNDDELEKIILKATNKELKFIIWIGGVIGFLIGCIQSLIIFV